MSSRAFVLIDPSSESSSVDDSSIEAEMDSSYSALCSIYSKPPSSKCAKVIMLPVYSWDDVVYGIYKTYGFIVSESEYGLDVYANTIENILSNTTSREETIFCVLGR